MINHLQRFNRLEQSIPIGAWGWDWIGRKIDFSEILEFIERCEELNVFEPVIAGHNLREPGVIQ